MATQLHAMIRTQPAVLDEVARLDVSGAAGSLRSRRLVVVGTGTSFHAAELGAYLLRTGGVDAVAVPAAEFARWHPSPVAEYGYVVISHTGSTAYAKAVCESVRRVGAPLVTITGAKAGWDGAIETPTHELSETYTTSYTAALGVLGLLAHAVAGTPTGSADLARAAASVRRVIDDPGVDGVDVPARALAVVGAGPWSVTAKEGALKIRESAHLLAEGFDTERLLHGAAVPYTGDDVLIGLQPDTDTDGLTAGVMDAARQEGVTVHTFTDPDEGLHPFLRQFAATVRLQLLAERLTGLRGTDPDVAITGGWTREELWSAGSRATN
jgi:glutamine---fructose-6-phosphate transaminase (isomerizing)